MNPASMPGSPYSFPVRALRRWARQQLALRPQPDGGLTAEFRLEAGTCGNVTFLVVYHVRLAPAEEGHRVLRLECGPAPDDLNHREQCAAKAESADFFSALAPPPLAGCTLDEALAWAPATSPEGCLCAETAQAHKWRAVLQTIHFALHQSPA